MLAHLPLNSPYREALAPFGSTATALGSIGRADAALCLVNNLSVRVKSVIPAGLLIVRATASEGNLGTKAGHRHGRHVPFPFLL